MDKLSILTNNVRGLADYTKEGIYFISGEKVNMTLYLYKKHIGKRDKKN